MKYEHFHVILPMNFNILEILIFSVNKNKVIIHINLTFYGNYLKNECYKNIFILKLHLI